MLFKTRIYFLISGLISLFACTLCRHNQFSLHEYSKGMFVRLNFYRKTEVFHGYVLMMVELYYQTYLVMCGHIWWHVQFEEHALTQSIHQLTLENSWFAYIILNTGNTVYYNLCDAQIVVLNLSGLVQWDLLRVLFVSSSGHVWTCAMGFASCSMLFLLLLHYCILLSFALFFFPPIFIYWFWFFFFSMLLLCCWNWLVEL